MKKEEIITKTCQNCRYFSQHYSKQGTRIRKLHCGHCLNQQRKSYKLCAFGLCGFWEDAAIKEEERMQDIKQVLSEMSEHLENIALILKDDLENR